MMTDELWALPAGIDYAIAQSAMISLFAFALVVLAFYASQNGRTWTVRFALMFAAVVSVVCVLFQNVWISFTPTEFWRAVGVLWGSSFVVFKASAAMAVYPYVFLIIAPIGVAIKFMRRDSHA